jgi:hypothetical protein
MQRARGRSIFLGDYEATSISGGGFQPGSVGEPFQVPRAENPLHIVVKKRKLYPSVAVDDSTQQVDDKMGIVKEGGA